MDKKQTTATCPKCGEEIVQCENCENTGCPDCDGFVVTRDDVILCPECAAAMKRKHAAERKRKQRHKCHALGAEKAL